MLELTSLSKPKELQEGFQGEENSSHIVKQGVRNQLKCGWEDYMYHGVEGGEYY